MGILLRRDTGVIVQNVGSRYGAGLLGQMQATGTRLVAGVAPGQGGARSVNDLPLFDTMADARASTGANAAILFAPAPALADAVVEAAQAGIRLCLAMAEHVPAHDAAAACAAARRAGMWLVGPNSLGLIVPGVGMLGALPAGFARPGHVGLMSRSGTLAITMLRALHGAGLGVSAAVSLGGDAIIGRRPAEYLPLFDADSETRAIVHLGEIGGRKEEELADAARTCRTPVFAMIVGRSAPEGRQLGHAGAMIGQGAETAAAKIEVLRAAGVTVCTTPRNLTAALSKLLCGSPC
jgi:succinyl-CoA synthetase alpha subunit